MTQQTYKILMIGDSNVGKTTFVQRFLTGEFQKNHVPTCGVDMKEITYYNTNYGKITLQLWDLAGREDFKGLSDGYHIEADATLLFFDMTNKESYRNLNKWKNEVETVIGRKPMVICGTKDDLGFQRVVKNVTLHVKWNCKFVPISMKTNRNFERPFLELLRELTGHSDLGFVNTAEDF